MNYKNIPAYEADFRAKGVDSDGKKFNLAPAKVTIPGTADTFEVVTAKLANRDESFFYKETPAKERVVVHFTAGYLKGDMGALTKKDNHVSTPFVVARDGTIYQLFASKFWSYHLGKGAQGGNSPMSKSGVAIEMSNVAYLREKNGTLVDPYGAPYCSTADTDAYQALPTPFRGYTRFATFTDAQYKSLVNLLRYLTATYKIPAEFIPEAKRYDVFKDVASFRGITTHVNYQPESYGKWDFGPAFDWARVEAGLKTIPVPPIPAPVPTPA
ncbi:MAG TPA: N-acetylmuramoyl-L-alanine amidase [Longimicrobium sp.]|jgi:N-acetyl-anhydromuramyl-L-alanine amidase AmpD|nr:N-acetylmuramoyl-L-alanine amidase [Longimicrobium sp.]